MQTPLSPCHLFSVFFLTLSVVNRCTLYFLVCSTKKDARVLKPRCYCLYLIRGVWSSRNDQYLPVRVRLQSLWWFLRFSEGSGSIVDRLYDRISWSESQALSWGIKAGGFTLISGWDPDTAHSQPVNPSQGYIITVYNNIMYIIIITFSCQWILILRGKFWWAASFLHCLFRIKS